tara:strand:+ start:51 stop:314 length:264 start_codon:yes stop_codon:yes gene_type:complete
LGVGQGNNLRDRVQSFLRKNFAKIGRSAGQYALLQCLSHDVLDGVEAEINYNVCSRTWFYPSRASEILVMNPADTADIQQPISNVIV